MKNIHVSPDPCIACTTCTVFCPVASATGEFLGPRMVGPAWERMRLQGLEEDSSLGWCANCKNCDISCPQGVDVAGINMMARARQYAGHHPHFLRDWIVSHNETLGHLIGPVPAALKNYSMRNPIVRGVLDVIGIARQVTMPTYAPSRFRQQLRTYRQTGKLARKVAFFPGCYVDLFDPQTGLDLVWALNSAGYEVVTDEKFCCCGVPMIASGFMDDAHANAERNLAIINRFAKLGIEVLMACPSCELMFREEIHTFFPDLAAAGVPFVRDAQEFLLELAQKGEFRPQLRRPSSPLLYHAPCHLRALGIGLPGFDLLSELGVEAKPANAGCCGISGSYGFKKERYAVSQKVGAELFRTVRESGASRVATECGTCRLQIASCTGVPAVHPVSVIRSLAAG